MQRGIMMKTKKVVVFIVNMCMGIFFMCYPYIKQIKDTPPLYAAVINYHKDRLSYDIIKSNYSRLSEKGYIVKTEDENIIISKNDLTITLALNKEKYKDFKPKVKYYHNVKFIFDTVEYKYYEPGLTIKIIYKTTIFSKKAVTISQLRELYNDLEAENVDDTSNATDITKTE